VAGLLLVRPDGPLFFANANPLRLGVLQLLATAPSPPRVVVLDLSSSFRLSVPTIDTLAELHDELGRRGVELWLARIRSSAMAELQASGLADRLGPAELHDDLEGAVQAYTNLDRHSPSE
jgi:SulP family sulfate permease